MEAHQISIAYNANSAISKMHVTIAERHQDQSNPIQAKQCVRSNEMKIFLRVWRNEIVMLLWIMLMPYDVKKNTESYGKC